MRGHRLRLRERVGGHGAGHPSVQLQRTVSRQVLQAPWILIQAVTNQIDIKIPTSGMLHTQS